MLNDFRQQLSEAKAIVSKLQTELAALKEQTRVRVTADEPPSEGDGDRRGEVLAKSAYYGTWSGEPLSRVAKHPDVYPEWTTLPRTKGEG